MSILRSNLAAVTVSVCVFAAAPAWAQHNISGADEIKLSLDRLSTVGSLLMIGAHPDDENTAVIAYFARGRNVDTAYLSLTRGEGGQNLIGPEQGDKLGVIRTEELLAARRVDGGRQFFTRAVDFGFTKSAQETMEKWGHDRILSDVVWVIRTFRPDVIVLRFSGTPRDGHGQHQASAILGKEAYFAAADATKFPEQLKYVRPWRAKRLLWNMFSFNRQQEQELEKKKIRIQVDTGEYNPLLGYSFGEIAGMSRSMHRSQGMGAPERKGSMPQFFEVVAGEPATRDPFDGIDTTWRRLPGGEPVARLLEKASSEFQPEHPDKLIPTLVEARGLIAAIHQPEAAEKLREIDNTIALCAGLWLDAAADRAEAVPGSSLQIAVTALNRSGVPASIEQVQWSGAALEKPSQITGTISLPENKPVTREVAWKISDRQAYTQPYWLVAPKQGDVYTVTDQRLIGKPENPDLLAARFTLRIGGAQIVVERPVIHRWVDRVRGELTRSVAIVPPVAIAMPENALIFPTEKPRRIEAPVRANAANQSGAVRLKAPPGWSVSPPEREFHLAEAGEQRVLSFDVTPTAQPTVAALKAVANAGGREVTVGMDVINYPHIPVETLFPEASSRVTRADIRTLARTVGYVMGAGDEVPQALAQIGCSVSLLSPDDLARGDLSRFDAIVTGVRAWNVRQDLRANRQRLFDYVHEGGVLVVQYNVLQGGIRRGEDSTLDIIGPYPIHISRDRVTVEEAPVTFPNPSNPVLHVPNEITQADFEGWVQERGLYFAKTWDPHYQSLIESHDPGEDPLPGGTLYTRYGKGAYIFTAYSWFRQLPAGVPGAYRIFANFLSAGKVAMNAN